METPSAAPQPPGEPVDHGALITAIAQRQDRAAFGVLFAHFAPRLKAWMMRAGAAPTAAEELAQETLLIVWRRAAQFDPTRAGASTWIFAIARNLRLDALRRERHPSNLMPDRSAGSEEAPSADHAYDAREREARIRQALANLPPEQAEIIHKAFFEDKAHVAIEKELGIPLGYREVPAAAGHEPAACRVG
ncbi:MAG: sigma-70 family RNA polymerase sigma factor [Rhodopila sp.]